MKNQALVTLVVLHVSVNAPHASNIDIKQFDFTNQMPSNLKKKKILL
jgi:hypothetical protein